MASYSGFIRKSPAGALRTFFETRDIEIPNDFDWSSDGRGTALVKAIDELLASLSDRKQDEMRAELDLLASLADENGLSAAEQVCAGQVLSLEGLEGVQGVLLFLAMAHPALIDRISVQSSLTRRNGGKNWAAFHCADDGKMWTLNDPAKQHAFLNDTVAILDLPEHRRRVADWYETIRTNPVTGKETTLTHATIYVEERAESELGFGQTEALERQVVQRVLEVGIACDPSSGIVEICAKGGKRAREEYAKAFSRNFAPDSEPPLEVPRRDVNLDVLRRAPDFEIEPADGIEHVEISSLDFHSTGGGFARFEKRGDDETVYQFLSRRFGPQSPLKASGWQIVAATLRIVLAPHEGQRRRTLTVTLRMPNTTTLPNKTEKDRRFVFSLLERWGLLAKLPDDFDVIETD